MKVVPDLLQYVTERSPTYSAPVHLEPLIAVLRDINRGVQRNVVVHTPPRHGKTETLLHSIPWLLEQHPAWTVGYASYSEQIALSKSMVARDLALDAGIQLRKDSLSEWRTFERGGALARGIGGGLTGMGLNVGIVDDPVKDRLQAESEVYRARVWDWFTDVFFTRIEPGGSCIVNMARWHPDDLAGRLVRERGWEYICLAAIDEDAFARGERADPALWPERWPVSELQKKRLNEYTWESLFQGRPRPRGTSVFSDPYVFESLDPTKPRRYAIGIDLSYSARSSSDWSVIVVMAECQGYYYVLHVERHQCRAPIFRQHLDRVRAEYDYPPVRWYASGTEQGVADMMNAWDGKDLDLPLGPGDGVTALPARGDKFVRALGVSAAWNAHKVLLQDGAEWLQDFVDELALFTGVADGQDDQVDALAAAFDELGGAAVYSEDLDDEKFRGARRW